MIETTPKQKRIFGLLKSWTNSALGQPLLYRILYFLLADSDRVGFTLQRQALSTLLCIIGIDRLFELLGIQWATSDQIARAAPTTERSVTSAPISITTSEHYPYFCSLLDVYAELLAQWQLVIQATTVRLTLYIDLLYCNTYLYIHYYCPCF